MVQRRGGRRLDGRSDLFSLGCVLLELLTKHRAFDGPNMTSIVSRIVNDPVNFAGLDRDMIRLNQNTQSVAQEARAAGQEARRVARSLDRAADAQGDRLAT